MIRHHPPMIRKRYYIPHEEIFRAYLDETNADKKPWNIGYKDYYEEEEG